MLSDRDIPHVRIPPAGYFTRESLQESLQESLGNAGNVALLRPDEIDYKML